MNIKTLRKIVKVRSKFFTLRFMSKKLKVSPSTLSRFINGKNISLKTYIKLCKYLIPVNRFR